MWARWASCAVSAWWAEDGAWHAQRRIARVVAAQTPSPAHVTLSIAHHASYNITPHLRLLSSITSSRRRAARAASSSSNIRARRWASIWNISGESEWQYLKKYMWETGYRGHNVWRCAYRGDRVCATSGCVAQIAENNKPKNNINKHRVALNQRARGSRRGINSKNSIVSGSNIWRKGIGHGRRDVGKMTWVACRRRRGGGRLALTSV